MSRTVPRLLGRFNYWKFPEICPEEDPVPKNQQRFALAGLDGSVPVLRKAESRLRACEREAWSEAIRRRPAARLGDADVTDALHYRMLSDPQWASDREVQAALNRLGREERATLYRRVRGSGAHDARELLQRIASDQAIWEARAVGGLTTETIAEKFGLGERRSIGEVIRHYNRQARQLQGLSAEFHGKALEDLRLLEAAGRCRLDGRRLVLGSRVCANDEEVRHWFAHALRNLARFLQRHPPIPWSVSCQGRCLAHRSRHLPALLRHPPQAAS